jgi:hypothetical protein
MRPGLSDLFRCNPRPASITYRLALLKNHAFELPRECRRVHVLSGTAWVTVAGRDIILGIGETMSFGPEKDVVLISALGAPVDLEVQGDYHSCQNRPRAICWRRLIDRFVAGRRSMRCRTVSFRQNPG